MSAYNPPLNEMQFLLHDVLGFSHPDLDRETTGAVLEEAAKFASGVLDPINGTGDKEGAKLKDGQVYMASGFKEAYAAYRDGGWNAVPFEAEYGGQGLPWAVAFPIQEMWQAANMSFGLCPLLNQGAVEAISVHGTLAQKEYYLPKLISGEWTGTMNLTEPQAGSDLGLLRSKAEKQKDGIYKISGQKIFITYGDHDMAENIIHLVLARLPDAPDDVKGISLFIVPKFLEDGTRNRVNCIGLEHKLGIHASPTCTMEFDGAKGYLIGEEHQGLRYMFTMMNNARLSVGLQGVAIADRAYQRAAAFAQERVQGKSFTTGQRVSIGQHPDVKRMLMTMRAYVWAGRGLAYNAALMLDVAEHDETAKTKVDFLTPIVKAYCTDMAVEVASLGVQVHGGMGFVEETGAAQYYRDARILPIYEGTNGIQAADLVFRKILRDEGVACKSFIESIRGSLNDAALIADMEKATDKLLACGRNKEMDQAAWLAAPYLKALGLAGGADILVKMEFAAKNLNANDPLRSDIIEIKGFYLSTLLPFAKAHLSTVLN